MTSKDSNNNSFQNSDRANFLIFRSKIQNQHLESVYKENMIQSLHNVYNQPPPKIKQPLAKLQPGNSQGTFKQSSYRAQNNDIIDIHDDDSEERVRLFREHNSSTFNN